MAAVNSRAMALTLIVMLLLSTAGPAAAQAEQTVDETDFAAMFSSFFDGDLSNDFGGMGGDAGLADVFGSLKELMDGMGGSFPIQTMQASAAPGAATAAASGDADAEAAAKLFASLFEGTSDSFATFLNGGGNGGAASSMFASFMSGSDSGSASSGSGGSASQQPRNNLLDSLSTLMGGRASGLSSLSSLLSSSTGSASGSGSSSQTSASHFAAVLGPVAASSASTRALLDSLSAAIDQADSLFDGPDLQDLFGGLDLRSFLSRDHEVLNQTLQAARELEETYCKPPRLEGGTKVPTNCEGHNMTLSITGGYCTFNKDKTVTCKRPSVVLFKNPPRCTLHHSEPSKVVGKECKIVKDYGQRVEGYLRAPKNKTHEMAASSQDVRSSPQLQSLADGFASVGAPRAHHQRHNITISRGEPRSVVGKLAGTLSGVRGSMSSGLSAMRERLSGLLRKRHGFQDQQPE
ncbi:hypothetical protein D9Q98_005594 [Chlorella vulgaris]|uniref:Uncharacterized protein n=1 Tax=Chlorella vulgaris TaxID=3077 RepID=A0A9D4YWC8_CHLVU|nr:hypothetical protein D9Q98_005594 [Chlorella vulgaris]